MNSILSFVTSSLMFLLILVSYFFIIKGIANLPFYFVGAAVALLSLIFDRPPLTPKQTARLAQVEALFSSVITLVFLILAYRFDLWSTTRLQIWENPVMIGLVLLYSVLYVSQSQSDNPIIRGIAGASQLSVWPILLLILIGRFAPGAISTTVFQWAVTLSAVLVIVAFLIGLRTSAPQLRQFEELQERHNTFKASLENLEKLANLTGDAENWRTVQEAIRDVNRWSAQALDALRKGRYQDADINIIQAETETARVERAFQDRYRLSLREELEGRLEQSNRNIIRLKEEAESAGLGSAGFDQLSDRVAELEVELTRLDVTGEDLSDHLLEQLEPFHELFREVVNTRTALRFRLNFGSAIEPIYDEISESNAVIAVAQDLGLDTDKAATDKNKLLAYLRGFQSGPIQTSKDLVSAYNSIQKSLTTFQEATAILKRTINRNWKAESLDGDQVIVYIPKVVSTSEPARGAILLNHGTLTSDQDSVSYELSGTLLELPTKTSGTIPISDEPYSVTPFNFAGKKGGKASLSLNLEELDGESHKASSYIQVKPTVAEIARNALMFAAPIGGVAVLVLWWLAGVELDDAARLGVAVGGLIGLIIFFLNWFSQRR